MYEFRLRFETLKKDVKEELHRIVQEIGFFEIPINLEKFNYKGCYKIVEGREEVSDEDNQHQYMQDFYYLKNTKTQFIIENLDLDIQIELIEYLEENKNYYGWFESKGNINNG